MRSKSFSRGCFTSHGLTLWSIKKTGLPLYRPNDDLWIWGDLNDCIHLCRTLLALWAWNLITERQNLHTCTRGPQERSFTPCTRDECSHRLFTAQPDTENWIIERQQVNTHIEQLKTMHASYSSIFCGVRFGIAVSAASSAKPLTSLRIALGSHMWTVSFGYIKDLARLVWFWNWSLYECSGLSEEHYRNPF